MGADGSTLAVATAELPQHFPQPGWVEHDPEEIWQTVIDAVAEATTQAALPAGSIAAIGLTNQRETALVWERRTGRPVHHAIVWQDRRTAERCARLSAAGHGEQVRQVTGLVIDPYFSATKVAWLLDEVTGSRNRAEAGELAFGTVDSFLVFQLAGGAAAGAPHVMEVTNASRTQLMALRTQRWDRGMAGVFGVPVAMLPRIVPSVGVVAHVRGLPGVADGTPIAGIAGDQQAALFGQACFEPGSAKCTYGTGAFVLANTGPNPLTSQAGLVTTIAWQIGSEVTYALEGSCFVAGAAVQWLRDGLGIIENAAEVERLARQVPDSDGVVFVPALAGLGAPHWDPAARGLIAGLTRRSTAAHLARATLESIAHQVCDLIDAMNADLPVPISSLRVDGGAAANDLLLTLQSEFAALPVERPRELETTARGAAMLAGVGVGIFPRLQDAAGALDVDRVFTAGSDPTDRVEARVRWNAAIRRARSGARAAGTPDAPH